MTTPKPGSWCCAHCNAALGFVTKSGDLVVTAVLVVIDRTRTAVVIRCPSCGEWQPYDGRTVKIDVPPTPRIAA